jgi:cytochrome c6
MRFVSVLATAFLVATPSLAQDGEHLFLDTCAACHQATGKGIPGAFPSLAGSKVAQGDPKGPIGRVLNGKGGMPAFQTDLSDAEISSILTYVRSSWGNRAKPISAAQVAVMRTGDRRENAKATLQAH